MRLWGKNGERNRRAASVSSVSPILISDGSAVIVCRVEARRQSKAPRADETCVAGSSAWRNKREQKCHDRLCEAVPLCEMFFVENCFLKAGKSKDARCVTGRSGLPRLPPAASRLNRNASRCCSF